VEIDSEKRRGVGRLIHINIVLQIKHLEFFYLLPHWWNSLIFNVTNETKLLWKMKTLPISIFHLLRQNQFWTASKRALIFHYATSFINEKWFEYHLASQYILYICRPLICNTFIHFNWFNTVTSDNNTGSIDQQALFSKSIINDKHSTVHFRLRWIVIFGLNCKKRWNLQKS